MVLVLTVLAALLAGGAVALMLQVNATKSSGITAANRRALFCAEAGLAAARTYMVLNSSGWDLMLDADASNDPSGYPVTADIDGDGTDDVEVTIRDDDDDTDPTSDVNGRVFLVSKCTKYPTYEAEVLEFIDVASSAANCTNRLQKGGCDAKGGNLTQ